jgi:hypothetical protein
MRALVPFALFLASVSPVVVLSLSACDQDYASSDEGRETFMGDTRQVPTSSASAPKAPPMAPPPMGAPPPPAPAARGDASTDAPAGSASSAGSAARAAGLLPPAH